MYEITMPKLSDSMEEGKIIAWKVKPGARVQEGDVLAEVESDKATMELECFHNGVLKEIVHGDGSEVRVGEVIGVIESAAKGAEAAAKPRPTTGAKEKEAPASAEASTSDKAPADKSAGKRGAEGEATTEAPEEKPAGKRPPARAEAAQPRAAISPFAHKVADTQKINLAEAAQERAHISPYARKVPDTDKIKLAGAAQERVAISPFARKVADTQKLDVRHVKATGPGGRITAEDIERAVAAAKQEGARAPAKPAATAEAPAKTEAPPKAETPAKAGAAERPAIKPSADEELPPIEVTADEADVVEASFRQKTQARRVVAAKHVIPHFYITRGVDVTGLLARKDELKEKYGATITHLVMLACIKALKLHPEVNRSYDRGKIIKWKGINLGLAVDTDEGLTVAVIPGAQGLSLNGIVERTRSLVEKARAGKLSPEERRHPTFTVSSLGMFDVENFQPIINPPSSVTLAVSSALPTPVVKDGMILIGRMMNLTLSCDHRIVDGVMAAKFLADLKKTLENVEVLLACENP